MLRDTIVVIWAAWLDKPYLQIIVFGSYSARLIADD